MWHSIKVPFLLRFKHPCKRGRCLTSMVCKKEKDDCFMYKEFDEDIDRRMSHYDGETWYEFPLTQKIEGAIFCVLMTIFNPKLFIKRITETIGNKLIEISEKTKADDPW